MQVNLWQIEIADVLTNVIGKKPTNHSIVQVDGMYELPATCQPPTHVIFSPMCKWLMNNCSQICKQSLKIQLNYDW